MQISQAAAWLVTVMLVEAAVIDGRKLKVPNWLTFHLALAGLAVATYSWGLEGLVWSLKGLAVGLAPLLLLYMIGGMGAGDVKLLAAVGTWCGAEVTFYATLATALAGTLIAAGMILWSGEIGHHMRMARTILQEIYVLRDPAALSAIAAERKPTMMLLPYGIPIAIGSIAVLAGMGLLA